MFRLVFVNILYFYISIYYVFKLIHLAKSKKYSKEEKYNYLTKVVKNITKKSRVKVDVEGLENLPKESGYVMYANHQGKFDGLAIMGTHMRPLSVVIKKSRSNFLLVKQAMSIIDAKILDINDLRATVKLFNNVSEEINNGNNYLIFPEGIYGDNKNNLQNFNTGCFGFVQRAKCPIVPVMLYDTYKVYNVNSFKKVKCKVHYLKPIEYEEYKNLNKKDLADLVKSRIQDAIDKEQAVN